MGSVALQLAFIALIAVVNLTLGYLLAMYGGWGPREFPYPLRFLAKILPALPPPRELPARVERLRERLAGWNPFASEAARSVIDIELAAAEDDANFERAASLDADGDPAQAVRDLPAFDDERQPLEQALLALRRCVLQSRGELLEIDRRLRDGDEEASAALTQRLARELAGTCQGFLDARGRIDAEIDDYRSPHHPQSKIANEAQTAVDACAAHVFRALSAAEKIAAAGDDPSREADGQMQLTDFVQRLAANCLELAESLAQTLLMLARQDGWLLQLDAELRSASEHRARGTLAGFDVEIEAWHQAAGKTAQPLCLALIDIDRCQELNRRFGPLVADRALQSVAELLLRLLGRGNSLASFSGQQHLLSFYETNAPKATNAVEQLRQAVEQIEFHARGERLPMTVSCAVIAAEPQDTVDDLLDRLRRTLSEAKRYGRNRTFLLEGDYPTPVVPPELEVEPWSIDVEPVGA